MNNKLHKIIFSLHPIERKALIECYNQNFNNQDPQFITGIQLLEQKELSNYKKEEIKVIQLDKFGEEFVNKDLPEIQLLKEVIEKEKKISQINLDKSLIGSAMGELKKLNLIETRKEDELIIKGLETSKKYLDSFENPLKEFKTPIPLKSITEKQKNIFDNFKQRKGFLKENIKKSFNIELTSLGIEVAKEIEIKFKNKEFLETLDSDMLKNQTWKNQDFRHYDINVETTIPQIGRRHPMLEANDVLKNIFLEMGFKEMEGPMVESAFWNMDVMWIPQDHPARDEQDTFYLNGECKVPEGLMSKVKKIHEEGIKNTHTTKGDWSEKITKKQLLRTHSTATSFRTLAELSKKQKSGENINGKYFYLANVFRNEAIDATHLAEFYQGEGFIIGDDLSLADLMGFVKEYLSKLGFDKVKFKPTFNPYTEPSMEAHIYDEQLDKWYALINSGIFRPETLKPLELENKTIIAWGFGASRIAAKLADKPSMRDITGATCDIEWLKTRKQMNRKVQKRGN